MYDFAIQADPESNPLRLGAKEECKPWTIRRAGKRRMVLFFWILEKIPKKHMISSDENVLLKIGLNQQARKFTHLR